MQVLDIVSDGFDKIFFWLRSQVTSYILGALQKGF
jgi:hypothetical protein